MLTAKTGKQANYRSNMNGDRGWGTQRSNLNHRKQDMMHSPATEKEGDMVTPREVREAGRCQCHMMSLQV